MPILFECFPVPDLRVIPVANILTGACLALVRYTHAHTYTGLDIKLQVYQPALGHEPAAAA